MVAKMMMMKEKRRNVKTEMRKESMRQSMRESMRGTGTIYKKDWASSPESGSMRSDVRSIAMLGFVMARTEGKGGGKCDMGMRRQRAPDLGMVVMRFMTV